MQGCIACTIPTDPNQDAQRRGKTHHLINHQGRNE